MSLSNNKNHLVIIPTYNEKENITSLIKKITHHVPGIDILIVDDKSPDGTAQEVRRLKKSYPGRLNLIVREDERGLGSAYRAGLKYGLSQGYKVLITMDADHSHNPEYLPKMLAEIKSFDVVIGSRYIRDGGTINWRIRRILLSWLANRFARFILRIQGSDLTSGYRAYRREILETIGLDKILSNGYSYLVEMIFRAQKNHAAFKEIPIIFYDRTMGKSKISRREIYRGAFTLFRLRLTSRSIGKDVSR